MKNKIISTILTFFTLAGIVSALENTSNASDAGLATGLLGTSIFLFYCVFCCFYIVMFVIIIVGLIFWIMMLIDVIQRNNNEFPNSKPNDNQKLLWILVLVLTSYIGAVIYYFMIYKKHPRIKQTK